MNPIAQEALIHLPVAAIVYRYRDGALRLLYMNRAAEVMWQCEFEQVKEATLPQLFAQVHPEDVPLFLGLKEVCHQGASAIQPICFRVLQQGQIRWMQMDVSTVAEPSSILIYTTITDVTQSKKLAAQLQIQKEEYRMVAEEEHAHVFRYNVVDKILHISSHFTGMGTQSQVVEHAPDCFIKKGFISPESIGAIRDFFEGMHQKKKQGSQRIYCVMDGEQRLIQAQYTLMDDGTGQETVAVGCFQDVAKTAENIRAVGREEKLFALVAAHSQKHIFRFDHKTNRATCMQSPVEDSLITERLMTFIQAGRVEQLGDGYVQALQVLNRHMLDGAPTGELEYPIKDQGRIRWHKVIFTNVVEENGENPYAVISIEDCTQERERAKAYALYQQEKADLPPGDSRMEYNVTQHAVAGIWGPQPLVDVATSAQDVLQTYLDQFVFAEDYEKVATFFNQARMLDAFANAHRMETLNHRIVAEGTLQWVESKLQYFQDPYTQDVMALISSKVVQSQEEQQESLHYATQEDGVTGLYAYQQFREKVDACCALATPETPGTFVLLGFDMTREAGVEVGLEDLLAHLKKVATMVKTIFTNGELLGRLEGHQFGIYIQKMDNQALLNDKLRLIMDLMAVEKRDVQYVRPFCATATCTSGQETTLALWQKTLKLVQENRRMSRSAVVRKAPFVTYDVNSRVVVRTFGFFDVFVDGQAIHFKTAKAKELLAILVNRCGGYVDASEGAMLLYEDDFYDQRLKSKYRKVVMRLDEILKAYGIEEIVGKQGGSRKLNTQRVYCDYYHYVSGDGGAPRFNNAYMSNYSWAEETLATLLK